MSAIRALSLLILVVLIAITGYVFGGVVANLWPTLENLWGFWFVLGAVLMSLALLFALLALPSSLRFVRCGLHDFRRCVSDLIPFLVILPLAFLIVSVAAHARTRQEQSAPVALVFGQSATHDAVFFPFFPAEGTTGGNCDPHQTTFGKGEQMAGTDVVNALKDLMRSLSACADDPAKKVRIDVRGFASSSEFERCRANSEQLNWRLAEARRRTILSAVSAANKGTNKILVEPSADHDRWKDVQEMRESMHFFDKNLNDRSYSREKAALTRRAEIIILSKGSCEPID